MSARVHESRGDAEIIGVMPVMWSHGLVPGNTAEGGTMVLARGWWYEGGGTRVVHGWCKGGPAPSGLVARMPKVAKGTTKGGTREVSYISGMGVVRRYEGNTRVVRVVRRAVGPHWQMTRPRMPDSSYA